MSDTVHRTHGSLYDIRYRMDGEAWAKWFHQVPYDRYSGSQGALCDWLLVPSTQRMVLVGQIPTFFAFAISLRRSGGQFPGLGIRGNDLNGATGEFPLALHECNSNSNSSMVHAWRIYLFGSRGISKRGRREPCPTLKTRTGPSLFGRGSTATRPSPKHWSLSTRLKGRQ